MPEPAELAGLVGAGVLRAATERRLPGELRANAKPVLAVSDGGDVAFLTETAATAAAQGVPFLGVHVELGLAVLGPAVLPRGPRCRTRVGTRRAGGGPARAGRPGPPPPPPRPAPAPP